MRNLVFGTAGHVDHGKTVLVRALTGMDTDTHREEKERGISIDIGFASLKLSSGQNIDIIDVPGHEKFIRNMLRGIFGVDAVMLVVAADDGVMPQTREHLHILELLGIKRGMIVVSKIDLVDDELLMAADDELRNLVKGTFLEGARLVHYSATSGDGLDDVRTGLQEIAGNAEAKERDKLFRLPVDRVFSVKGYGTVVTGTVAAGSIKVGDEVELYPGGPESRVRNIQIHREDVDTAEAGQRVGLNLTNVEVEKVKRGMVLSEPGALLPAYILNTRLNYLGSNPEPLFNRQKVKVYSGTSEQSCRVVLTDREEMVPGTSAFVQLRLEKRVASLPFDRYVIRSLSPACTIGGGSILETICQKAKTFDARTKKQLELLEKGEHQAVIETITARSVFRPLKVEELSQRCGLNRRGTRELVDILQKEGILLAVSKDFIAYRENYKQLKTRIVGYLKDRYREKTLELYVFKEELRTKISPSLDVKLYDCLLADLTKEGIIAAEGSRVRLVSREVNLRDHQKRFCRQIETLCSPEKLIPVWPSDIQKLSGEMTEKERNDLIRLLAFEKKIVILAGGSMMNPVALEKARTIVESGLSCQRGLTLAELKGLLGIGRRAAQSILEYFDEAGFTRRIGEVRVLK